MDVYLFDTQFRHVLAGGREKERLKLSNADFIGKTLFEVYDEKTQKRLFPFYRNALDGKQSEGEVRIKKNVYFVSATPVYGFNRQVVGGALISQDVTKEKEVEKNLIKAKREAEEADHAKSLFLANMSHEIRTPLNAIIGFTGLLNKTDLTPKQKKFSRLISQSSGHLLSVVNEVLFLFKLGMGKVYIEKVPFNCHELVKNVKESLLFRAKEKGLELDCIIDVTASEIVIGDPFRVKQILMNLTGNALKYTDKGKVTLRVLTEKNTAKKTFLRFEVEDTGIGIPKEDLDTIFEEFAQPGEKNDKMRKGAGLGLTIVKKLVDLFNGRIHVESEPGEGSRFSVVIPFELPKDNQNVPDEKNYNLEYKQLEGKRILYADDDENNLLLGESILRDWNIDFELAADGKEALQLLQQEKFDIVLLDIQMPGHSGVDIVKKVRKDSNNPNRETRMLAVTANIMESDLKKYLIAGFNDYILKPFSEEKLYSRICNLLNVDYENVPGTTKADKATIDADANRAFDTSELLKTAGGDFGFFNQMIDTFILNAKDTVAKLKKFLDAEEWEAIGKRAHKAIPSFRYFKLTEIADQLTRLENLALHQKEYSPMAKLTKQTVAEIDDIIEKARRAKIPEEDRHEPKDL